MSGILALEAQIDLRKAAASLADLGDRMRRILFVAGLLFCSWIGGAAAEPLIFNGVSGRSDAAAVQRRFPSAETDRMPCSPEEEVARYADGVSRCNFLRVPTYRLAGYDFSISFFFHESGSLKTAALTWPSVRSGETPTSQELRNAYGALVDLFVSRYGRYVEDPTCSLIGENCAEWQADGTTTWHAGGERIRIRYVDHRSGGVYITYTFADFASFGRF